MTSSSFQENIFVFIPCPLGDNAFTFMSSTVIPLALSLTPLNNTGMLNDKGKVNIYLPEKSEGQRFGGKNKDCI